MKCAARVALGVAGGYFLGRTKKMKLALMLGGMMAGRRVGGPAELLAQGGKLVSRSPELARLTEDVRGRLFEAGKDAALAVATRQVESWADRVANPRVSTAAGNEPPDRDEDTDDRDDRAAEPADDASEDSAEDSADDTDQPSSRRGAASRSRSGGTATRTRRASSTRGSGRTRSTGGEQRRSRPARSGREGRDA